MKQTFKKEERLSSRKLIELLFGSSKYFFQFPFRVLYCEVSAEHLYPAQLLISVSKRNFKKATERNYIKRLIREAYRKNKEMLYLNRKSNKKLLLIGLVFTSKTIPNYTEIEQKLILILQRLNEMDE